MKRILPVVISAMLLSSCAAYSSDSVVTESKHAYESSTVETTSTYDPFASASNESSSTINYSYGIEYQEGEEKVLHYAATISFQYYVDNQGSDNNFGLLLFANGIRQPYRTKEEPQDQTMHIFDVKQNERKVQTIEFEPIVGNNGEELSLEIVSMVNPRFVSDNNSVYQFNHRIMSPFPSIMQITDTMDKAEPSICSVYDITPITEELRKEYNKMDSKGEMSEENSLENTVYFETLKNGIFLSPNDYLAGKQDVSPFTTEDSISVCMYGGSPCIYRVSMFINHELVPGVFDGADYLDMEVSGNQICTKTIELKKISSILQNCNSAYFIAIPFYSNQNYNERMVIKTPSVTVRVT